MLFLKLFVRNIRRGGIYSVINVGGPVVGMTAAGLILLWVFHHLSYDRFHAKDKHLFAAVGGLIIGIALMVVCFQVIKAATANPVKAIKNE